MPVLMYGRELWTMEDKNESTFQTSEIIFREEQKFAREEISFEMNIHTNNWMSVKLIVKLKASRIFGNNI